MNDYSKITTKSSHGEEVFTIVLNSPRGNILDGEMMGEITEALRSTGSGKSVKAVVFEGEGSHFSFGASVEEHRKAEVAQMLATFHDLIGTLVDLSKPALAVVNGQCLGGGLELAALCHWIFAHPSSHFGQPEIKLGVFPPVASRVLPHIIGQRRADDLILTGRSLTAEEARQSGLVYSVSKDPREEARDFITSHLLPKSASSLEYAVLASRFEMYRTIKEDLKKLEEIYLHELMETEDAQEGIQAFLEKREGVWKNC